MFEEILGTYEKNCKVALSFVQPEPVRKMAVDIVNANFGLVREIVPAMNRFAETLTNIAAKSAQ